MIDQSNPSVRLAQSRATPSATANRPPKPLETNGVGDKDANARRAQLKSAAQAFEAVFLRQMIGSMRQAKLGEDLFGSQATDQFREMGDARLADQMAKEGGFGIAEMMLKQMDAATGALKK
jgi:flagellar protein FlgJ